jgi:hypothetical protein
MRTAPAVGSFNLARSTAAITDNNATIIAVFAHTNSPITANSLRLAPRGFAESIQGVGTRIASLDAALTAAAITVGIVPVVALFVHHIRGYVTATHSAEINGRTSPSLSNRSEQNTNAPVATLCAGITSLGE